MRVGTGYDVHTLVSGRPLILGGVNIPYNKGLLGYSDADVLVHAIMDALLGAAGLKDIGQQFPTGDAKYRDICSLELLEDVRHMVAAAGCTIKNVDSTIIAEEPKISPFVDEMRGKIANSLRIEIDQVMVKSTTTDGLGFTGRGEGIAAQAIALLEE